MKKQRNSEKMWRFGDFVGSSEHRIIGSSEFKRNLYGCFLGVARAQEIFEGNL